MCLTAAGSRWQHDVRGYLGVIGQVVIAARLQVDLADGPLPAYAKPILGGADTLRGIGAGFAVGDNLWAGTIEARAPFTSVLRSTRLGVLAFYDTGATWNYGQRWRDAGREEGVGGGVFLVQPVLPVPTQRRPRPRPQHAGARQHRRQLLNAARRWPFRNSANREILRP